MNKGNDMLRKLTPCLAALLLAATATAQSFNFPTFTGTEPLSANGAATLSGTVMQLTSATAATSASLFHQLPLQVELGFETVIDFRITPPAGNLGGDGIAFVIHNDPRADLLLGDGGNQMGYGALAGSPAGTGAVSALVVEIDTLQDSFGGFSDISANELSVHTNGTLEVNGSEGLSLGRVGLSTTTANMSNGQVHNLRIRYVPGTLEIYLDNAPTPTLSVPYSFVTGGTHLLTGQPVGGLGLSGGAAWVGMTSACGTSIESHEILSWSFATLLPATYPGNASDFDCRVSVNNVLSVDTTRVIPVSIFDTVALRFISPNGGTDGQYFSAFYQLFGTGSSLTSAVIPGETPPGGFWLDAAGTNLGAVTAVVPYIDGIGFGGPSFLAPILLPGGSSFSFVVPPIIGGAGLSLLLQAVVVDPGLNGLNLGIDDCIELQVN